MKITILGSSGQIGSYLTEYLRKKDYEVFEFDIVKESSVFKFQHSDPSSIL